MEDKTPNPYGSSAEWSGAAIAEDHPRFSSSGNPEPGCCEFDEWSEPIDDLDDELDSTLDIDFESDLGITPGSTTELPPADQIAAEPDSEADDHADSDLGNPDERKPRAHDRHFRTPQADEELDFGAQDSEEDYFHKPFHDESAANVRVKWFPGQNRPAANTSSEAATVNENPGSAEPAGPAPDPEAGFWKSKLDEQARAVFEERAANLKRRKEKFQKLEELSARVKYGDEDAIADIELILEGDEAIWRLFGDLTAYVELPLIDAISGGIATAKQSLRRSVNDLRKSLAGEKPRPLEQLAVDHVVASWLSMKFVDMLSTAALRAGSRAGDLARAQELAAKRHQHALKDLKLVQQIKTPAERQEADTQSAAGGASAA